MKFILGEKKRMTQIFDAKGRVWPATLIAAGKSSVTALKTEATDGYTAVQIGYGERKLARIAKPERSRRKISIDGQTDKAGWRHLREFRVPPDALHLFNPGQELTLSQFAEGERVSVSGVSKAKGFQGVVKRHGFHGGPRTHGQKHSEREPGSIGGGLRTRVPKGMRMAGRMGGDRITVKNLEVVKIDSAGGQLCVRGAVPGRRGTLLEIKSAK